MSTLRPSASPSILLNQQVAWQNSDASFGIIEDRAEATLRLGEKGVYAISPKEPKGTFGGQTLPRGVAISPFGFMLLADTSHHQILYYDTLSASQHTASASHAQSAAALSSAVSDSPKGFSVLWRNTSQNKEQAAASSALHEALSSSSSKPMQPSFYDLKQPMDIKLSALGELIIADTGNNRVLIMTWPELRVRHCIYTPEKAPTALETDAKGNLYVSYQESPRIVKYNALWQLDTSYGQTPSSIQSPSAMARTSNGYLVVLCERQARVFILDERGRQVGDEASDEQIFAVDFVRPPLGFENDRLSYPQIKKPRCASWHLEHIDLDSRGNIRGTDIRLLTRPRVLRLPRSGEFRSLSFDSENLASQWHRIAINAHIPRVCKLTLQTFTSDVLPETLSIDEDDWSEVMLLTSPALDAQTIEAISAVQNSSFEGYEALVQSGKGRYLSLRIGFYGDGFSSPSISDITLFADRNSSLAFLPEPYRQDPQSEFFLDRWLSYFDTVFAEISFLAKDFTRHLDPHAVPSGEFLNWLGTWFDWTFLAQWPESTRREMIARAFEYYQMRGTLQGVKQMVQWHTGLSGNQPSIIEHYRLREQFAREHALGNEALPATRDDSPCAASPSAATRWFIGQKPFTPDAEQIAHWFSVIVPASAVSNQSALDSLNAVIEAQKPAHTGFRICLIKPGLRVGKQSSIGIDTWLGHYPSAEQEGFTLGQSSHLKSHDREKRGTKQTYYTGINTNMHASQ